MKQFRNTSILVLIIATAVLFSGCSRHKMYTMAIDSKRNGADLTVKTVNISIGEITYLDNADARSRVDQDTVIMVHGFGGNKDNWVLLADRMTRDYRIIALDLPGHGNSVSNSSLAFTVAHQAEWLNEFMGALGIAKAHVMGNSMGGAICTQFTLRYPEKVLSMTLVDSAGLNVTKSELVAQLEKGINPLVAGNTEEYERLMDFVMEKKPYIPGPLVSVMAEEKIARKDLDQKIFKDILADIIVEPARLSTIHTPTLIIWGADDRVIHVDNAEAFHRDIQGSRKVVLAGLGHLPMIEDPKKTCIAYKEFLATLK